MQCGVLCDKNGNLKRRWSLVSAVAIVPVEDGDQVIEWEVDHGEALPHTTEKLEKIKAAVKEQELIPTLTDRIALDAHLEAKGRVAMVQAVRLGAPLSEPIYYSPKQGLHHRRINDEGEVIDVPSETRHRMEQIDRRRAP